MKFSLPLLAVCLAFLVSGPVAAEAQSFPMIDVKVNRAKVMRVSRPAAMVIIGNPGIADATIKDSQTLIITGKQYGTTNLIVLDSEGEPIADELLKVSAATDNNVVVFKGSRRFTLSCAPNCEPVFIMGDDKEQTTNLVNQIEAHKNMSKGEEVNLDE